MVSNHSTLFRIDFTDQPSSLLDYSPKEVLFLLNILFAKGHYEFALLVHKEGVEPSNASF